MVTIKIIALFLVLDVWDLVSFAKSEVRRMCLKVLSTGPKTPVTIARETSKHMSHVSRSLRELEEQGLAECLTPSKTKNRIFAITKKGEQVLETLEEMEPSSSPSSQ